VSAQQWRTVRTERTVLAVVHNTTAATRLFDILPLFANDPRVETVFTCPGSSAFTEGTDEFLARAGITRLVPWKQAVRRRSDLAIAASYGGDLHEITAPLMVVPHGMGYNKYLGDGVFGLSSPWLLHRDRLVPSIIVLSHTEQLARLAAACPRALVAATVAGDPCFDRMVASRPLRESYRQAFGVRPGQRLIVISSTWGDSSLYGRDPGLVSRLASRLDLDSYRLAVALHPNITVEHTRWQVRMWLEDCARAGVFVLPSEELWSAALLAADLTIGDHGSVSFYSAALGTPLLLAAAPASAVDPESAIAKLMRLAPRFDPDRDPARQIEDAIGTHDPKRLAEATCLTTSRPGESAHVLRETIYRWLKLKPRTTIAPRALPVPEVEPPRPHAHLATVDIEHRRGEMHATVTRRPVAGDLEHLVVDVREPEIQLLNRAEVIMNATAGHGEHWIAETLRALPGCRVAVIRDGTGWLAGTPDGLLVRFDADADQAPVIASVLRALPEPPSRVRVLNGGESYPVTFRPVRPAGPPRLRRAR